MAEENLQDKTEKATPKRREDARKKGQVAKSQELASVAVLSAGLLVLYFAGYHLFLVGSSFCRGMFGGLTFPLEGEGVRLLFWQTMKAYLLMAAPVMGAVVLVGLAVNYLQVGGVWSPEPLRPKLDKLSPAKGAQRLFSKQAAAELFKSLAKIAIIGYVTFATVRAEFPNLLPLVDNTPGAIVSYIGIVSLKIFFRAVLAMALLAALDYGFQRWEFERNLRMSRTEVKEEFKQTEGDPLIKSRIKALQREIARRRMMEEVPKADVVITNPTELAVALRYESGKMTAPQVVAKGQALIAARIREIATAHGVPVIEDAPLAQALYKTVEVGAYIPFELYQAVAEILAYVYRLKGRMVMA